MVYSSKTEGREFILGFSTMMKGVTAIAVSMGFHRLINCSTWEKESVGVQTERLVKLKSFGMIPLAWILISLESYTST